MAYAQSPIVPSLAGYSLDSLGRVKLPSFLEAPTGHFAFDVMPCVTLAVILPTFLLFLRARLYADAALALVAGGLAFMFHWCGMSELGLANVVVLGVDGAMWRTLDILAAQVSVARTLAHSLDGRVPHVAAIPNMLLPAILTFHMMQYDRLDMGHLSGITLGCMLLTLGVKLGTDGPATLPDYSGGVGLRILFAFCAAFACFVAPHAMPQLYWFWHSAWHVWLGVGYYELYRHLLSPRSTPRASKDGSSSSGVRRSSSGSSSSSGSACWCNIKLKGA